MTVLTYLGLPFEPAIPYQRMSKSKSETHVPKGLLLQPQIFIM